MAGSCATDDCEIRQDRKAAAVSRNAGCRRSSWPELLPRKCRDAKTEGRCTVFVQLVAGGRFPAAVINLSRNGTLVRPM